MKKIIKIIMVLFVLFILERLYLLPIYVSLATKPTDVRSAAYLAKSIAHEADANIELAFMKIEFDKNARVFPFYANIEGIPFTITIYLDKNMRDIALKNANQTNHVSPCFKAGNFYKICETYSVRSKKDKPIFRGKKYYSRFPGEDITLIEKKKKDNRYDNIK